MTTTSSRASVLMACLGGLAIALMVVGVVSGTLLRHIVQIVPVLLALAMVSRLPPAGAYAALPIFIFWFLIVSLIWLFLAGLSTVAQGHYTAAEKVSTLVMAACCGYGVVRAVSAGRAAPISARVVLFMAFAVLQFAAMWISMSPSIANR